MLVKVLKSSPDFPVLLRLIRTIIVIVRHFHRPLGTECEMFLSMLVRRVVLADSSLIR